MEGKEEKPGAPALDPIDGDGGLDDGAPEAGGAEGPDQGGGAEGHVCKGGTLAICHWLTTGGHYWESHHSSSSTTSYLCRMSFHSFPLLFSSQR